MAKTVISSSISLMVRRLEAKKAFFHTGYDGVPELLVPQCCNHQYYEWFNNVTIPRDKYGVNEIIFTQRHLANS